MSTSETTTERPHGLAVIAQQVSDNIKSYKHVTFGGGAIVNSNGEVVRVEYYCPPGSKLFNFFLKHRDEIKDIIKEETALALKLTKKSTDYSTSAIRKRPVVSSSMVAEAVIPQPIKPILFLPRNEFRCWFPLFLEAVYRISGSNVTVPTVFPSPLQEWDEDVDKIMTRDEFLLLGPEARLVWKVPRVMEGVTHYYQTNTFLWKLRLVAALILRRYGINFNMFAKEVTAADRGYNLLSEEQIIGLHDHEDCDLVDFLNGARAVLSFEIGDFIVETSSAARNDMPVFEVGDGYILREFHVEYAKGNYIGYYCTNHIKQMTGASEGNYVKIKIVKKTEAAGKNKHVTRFLPVEQQETEKESKVRKAACEEVVVLEEDDDVAEVKEEVLEEIEEDQDDQRIKEEPVDKKPRLTVFDGIL